MADWVDGYYEYGEPVYMPFLREKRREEEFLASIIVAPASSSSGLRISPFHGEYPGSNPGEVREE